MPESVKLLSKPAGKQFFQAGCHHQTAASHSEGTEFQLRVVENKEPQKAASRKDKEQSLTSANSPLQIYLMPTSLIKQQGIWALATELQNLPLTGRTKFFLVNLRLYLRIDGYSRQSIGRRYNFPNPTANSKAIPHSVFPSGELSDERGSGIIVNQGCNPISPRDAGFFSYLSTVPKKMGNSSELQRL